MLDLKARLCDWMSIPRAVYELGAHLGFWEEYGNRAFHDPYHGHQKEILTDNPKSEVLYSLLHLMIETELLETNEQKKVKWKKTK